MSKKSKTSASNDIRYEVITQEDPVTGDLLLPIPQPILDQMNWKEGDDLEIDIGTDGHMYIKKASK